MPETFYVSTPIYYVNDVPHIGHVYTTVACDALARHQRMLGREVFFLTGTDEHGQKVEKAAFERGEKPIDLANRVVARFRNLWEKFNISNDKLIRTTQPEHRRSVELLYEKINKNGDVYLGEYEDWYCMPCETFWTETQLIEGNCPECNRQTEKLKEPSYFFRLSKYRDPLLKHIEENPDFIRPASRKNEIIAFLREGLRDLSLSRAAFSWGIPIPDDPSHIFYVWFDALINYATGVGHGSDDALFSKFWPPDMHIIGKDILRFHAIYWPAFLMSAGLPLPRTIFAHGWWTVEGRKMSKSQGNVVDPWAIAEKYGVDAFRYFLLREVPFGLDGDFSREAMEHRINADLANDLGNLESRTLAMLAKYRDGVVPDPSLGAEEAPDVELKKKLASTLETLNEAMEATAFHKALIAIWGFVSHVNKYIDSAAPWTMANNPKEAARMDAVLYNACEALRAIAILILPFMPGSGEEILRRLDAGAFEPAQLLASLEKWGGLKPGSATVKGDSLFPRVERH